MASKKKVTSKKAAPKQRTRKPLTDIQKQAHAWAQQAYTLKTKLHKAEAKNNETERSKIFNTLLRLQLDRQHFNEQNGIKRRTSSEVKKAKELGKDKQGLITEYDFRNTKSAKQQLIEYAKSPFLQRVNGKPFNPLNALSTIDNLILEMESDSGLFMVFDELTGDLYIYVDNNDNEDFDSEE